MAFSDWLLKMSLQRAQETDRARPISTADCDSLIVLWREAMASERTVNRPRDCELIPARVPGECRRG